MVPLCVTVFIGGAVLTVWGHAQHDSTGEEGWKTVNMVGFAIWMVGVALCVVASC